MGTRIVRLDTATHQAVQELLPWFVTNTLGSEEMELVRKHLQTCRQCQSEVEWQRRLQQVPEPDPQPAAIPDVEHALARLRPRIEARPAAKPRTFFGFLKRMPRWNSAWMPWALAGQAVIVAVLAIFLAPPFGGPAPYRAMGVTKGAAGEGTAGNVVVVFRPDTAEAEIRRILQQNGARVVDGPTAADAYVIAVPSARQAIDALRSERAVTLAEPLESGGER